MILITNVVLIFGLISAVICQVKASKIDASDPYGDGSQRHHFFFRGGGHEEFNILRERSAKDPLEERSSAVINEKSLLDTKSQDEQTKTDVDSSHLFRASPEQDGQNMLSKLISITTQNGRNIGVPNLNNQTDQISKSESDSVRKVYDFNKEPFLPIPGPFSNSKFPKPSFIYHIKRPSTFEENIFKKQDDPDSRAESRNSGKSVGENGQQNDSPLHSQSSIDQQTSFKASNFYQRFPFFVQFPVHSGNNPSKLSKYSQEERSDPSSIKDSDNGQYFVNMFHRVANKPLNFSDSDITETPLPETSKDDFRTSLGISWKDHYPKPSTAERDSKGNPKYVKDDVYDESSQIPAQSSRAEKLAQPRQDQTLKDVRTFYVNGPYFEDTTNYGTDDWSLRDRVVIGGDDTTEGIDYSKNSPYENDATIFNLGSQTPTDDFIPFQNKHLHKSTETLDEHTDVDNGGHADLQRNTPLGEDYYKHLFGEVSSSGGTRQSSGLINGFNEYRQAAAGRHEFAVEGPGEWKTNLKSEIKPSDHEQEKISFAAESSSSKDIDLRSTLSEINQKNEFPEIPTTRESPLQEYKEELDIQNRDPISKNIVSYYNKNKPMTEAEFTQNSNGRGNDNSGNLEKELSGNMSPFVINENLKPVVHVYTIIRKTSKGTSGERGSNDDSKSYRQGIYFDGSFETGPFLRDEVAMFGKQRNNDDSEAMSETYGKPGHDFPVHHRIPVTSFHCKDQEFPGYYADPETNCQVFHRCQIDGTMDSFLCPNASIFNQKYFVCDWWYNVDCQQSRSFYHLNSKWMEETDDNEVENALKEHGFISHITDNGFMLRVGDLKHPLINSAVDENSVANFGRDVKGSSEHEEDLQRNVMKDESKMYEQEEKSFQKSDQEQMIRSHIPLDSVSGDFVKKKGKNCKKSKPNEGIVGMRKLGVLTGPLSVSNFPNAKFENSRSLKQENTFEKTEPIGLKGEISDISDIENFNRGYGYALNTGNKYFGPRERFGYENNFRNSGLIRENTRPSEVIRSKEYEKPDADRNFEIETYVDNENLGKKTFRENETPYPNEDISDEVFQRDFGIRNQNHKFGDDGKSEKENTFSSSKYSKANEGRDKQEYDHVHLSHDSPILFKNGDGRNEDENIFSSSKYSEENGVRDQQEHEHDPLYDSPIRFKNGDEKHEDETTFSSSKYSKANDVRDQQEYDHVPLYDAPISFKNGDQFRDDFNLGKKYIFGENIPLTPEAKYIRTTEEGATSSVNKNFGYDENLGKKISVNLVSGEEEGTKQKHSDNYDPVSPFKSDYVKYGEDVGTPGSILRTIGESQHEKSLPYGPRLQITDVDYDGGKHDHGENEFKESLSYREHGIDDAIRNVPDDAFNPLTQYRNGEKLRDKITDSETMRYNDESDVEDEDTGGYTFALNYESKNPEEKENHEEKIIFQPNNGHRPNEEIFDVAKYEEKERHGSVPHENEENQFGNHGDKEHVFVNSEPYEPEEETTEVSELGDIDESDSVFYIKSKNNHNFKDESDFEGTEISGLKGGMIRIVEQDKYNPEVSFENGNPEDEKSFGAKINLENSGIYGSNGELIAMIEKGGVGESETIKQNFGNDGNLRGIREITGFALSETDRKLLEDAVEKKVEEYNLENNFEKEKYIQDEFGPKVKFRESGVHLPDKELIETMQPDSSGDYESGFHYTDELKNNEDFARENKFSGINIFGLGGGPSDNERKRVNDLISQLEAEHFRDAAIYGQKIRLDKIGLNEKLADQKERDHNIGYGSIGHFRNGYFKNGEYGQGRKFTESGSYVPNIEIIDLSNQEKNDAEFRVQPFEYERFKGDDDFGRKIRFDDNDLYVRNEGVNDETKTRQTDNFDSSGSYRFGNDFGRANGFESNEPSGSKERMSGHGEGKYREIEGYDSLIGFENKFKFDKNFGRKIRFEDSPSVDGKGSSDNIDLKYIGRLKDFLRIRENFGKENKFSRRGLFSSDDRNADFGHQENNDGNYDGARFEYGRFKDDDSFGRKIKFVDTSPNSEVRNEPNFEAMSRYSRHFPNDGYGYDEKLGNSGSFGEFRFPEVNERILGESGHEGYDSIVRFEKEKLKLGQDFGQKIRYDETQQPEMKRDESFVEFDSIHRDPNRNDFQQGKNEGGKYTFWESESTKRDNERVGVMNHKQIAGYGSPFHLRSDTFTDADDFGEKIVPLKV